MTTRSILWMAAFGVGCATDGNGPGTAGTTQTLTCEIIAGPNCWKDAVDEVAACAPGVTVAAKMSADGRTCTYPSGDTATFDTNATAVASLGQTFAFDLTAHGAPCVGFSDEGDGTSLRTASGTAAWETIGKTTRLRCPDGTAYEAETFAVQTCPGFADLRFVTATSATTFQFSLGAKPTNVDVLVCGM